ncbi:MAG: CBS domain-containing protein [Nitrospiraceae bacterium]|nr:CBS domain-containing protein [Nitrospiraceae bacterium]
MDIITSHINADFDAFASMVAALRIYPGASLVFPGSQERNVRDFIEVFHPVPLKRIKEIDPSKITRLIVVDTKQAGRIASLANALTNRDIRIHVYDHHPVEAGDLRGETEKIEEVGATATIFTEILKERKVPLSPLEATLLALGIYEETGSLLFPSTTERDMLAAAWLLKKGANLNIVSNYVKRDLNVQELELLNELIKTADTLVIGGVSIAVARASRDFYVGDAAHLAHRIIEMEDVDAVALLLDMGGKILIVFRSRVPELNVAELAKEFGGGGHPTAASATLGDASIEIVSDRLRGLLPAHVKPGKVAADIMTTPVITIRPDSTIKEAEETMTRYGVNVLPVLNDGVYAGLISREVVEKAIFHGFRKNRCIDFTTPDALTVETDTPIREIETSMIEHNQRFMPVMRKGVLAGAITRTDLLRVLYEDFLRKRHLDRGDITERTSPGRNLASWLKDRFPKDIFSILQASGKTAETMGYSAYLVGGSVRDLLLREENLDIDLVIEGDGILFARTMAERLHGTIRAHEKFGTATIIIDNYKIDVATARTEYYESPAALPTVETSSIKKDLYRRDFTINTLAVKLNQRDFGKLIDFFGGQRDIREKTIRVLHNLSFIEDPTRAFRAIRFSERFGFRLSRHTENLIKSALKMNLFDRLSGFRLYEELVLAFRETNAARTIKRLSEFDLLKVIHPDLSFCEELQELFASVGETWAWYNLLYYEEKADIAVLYLMALFSELSDEARLGALYRLSPPPRVHALIASSEEIAGKLLARLPLEDPAAAYHLLIDVPLETLLFAMSSTGDRGKKKDISNFLVSLKKVRPLLKGRDLRALGIPQGPVYSKILRGVLDEKLRGNLPTEEEEREFVVKHFPPAK